MPAKSISAVTAVAAERTWSLARGAIPRNKAASFVAFALIVLAGAFVRFYALGAHSIGNLYYAATVRTMLTSWHNFFFASFEPGGSVSVDKPPLGFWIEAASSAIFGVNGFALALPQALAGVLSIIILHGLVRRQFGEGAALLAALVLAFMPVTVATERNNTIDGVLVFVLLAATWMFWRATTSGGVRYLLIGAILVGIGFNVKMLQAFLPLPALYAAYLVGARATRWRRLAYLATSWLVLLAISAAWAVVVDLTPPDQRPYVGSSADNTVRQLILGHNGLARLRLGSIGGGPVGPPAGNAGPVLPPPGGPATGYTPHGVIGPLAPAQSVPLRPAPDQPGPPEPDQLARPPSQPVRPGPAPVGGDWPADRGPMQSQANVPGAPNVPQPKGPSQEVGEPGPLRLFREPLVTEASWLLPLALFGIPLAFLRLGLRRPWRERHLALLLWSIWLLVEVAYFSFTGGIFHTYYLIMLGPPLAALTGAMAWSLREALQNKRRLGRVLLIGVTGGTLLFAIATLRSYPDFVRWTAPTAIALWLGGLALVLRWGQKWTRGWGLALVLASLLVAPAAWSLSVAVDATPDVGLPRARPRSGPAAYAPPGPPADANPAAFNLRPGTQPPPKPAPNTPARGRLVSYLLANAAPDGYLVATHSTREAAPLILATGRPVLTMGGFSGGDNVVDVPRLSSMIASGKLRFVLAGPRLAEQKPQIAAWLGPSCRPINEPGLALPAGEVLHDCGRKAS